MSNGLLATAGVFWLLFISGQFLILAREEFTPAKTAPPVMLFPRGSVVQLVSEKPTLLLFAHPHCPCTRASLHELNSLVAGTQDKVSVIVIFTIPDGIAAGWEKGDLLELATSIPNLRVIRDTGGREAHRFDVEGSGHVLLYAPSGKLLFSGGITASRGHEGDDAGRSAIVSLILKGLAAINHTAVFGCSLL